MQYMKFWVSYTMFGSKYGDNEYVFAINRSSGDIAEYHPYERKAYKVTEGDEYFASGGSIIGMRQDQDNYYIVKTRNQSKTEIDLTKYNDPEEPPKYFYTGNILFRPDYSLSYDIVIWNSTSKTYTSIVKDYKVTQLKLRAKDIWSGECVLNAITGKKVYVDGWKEVNDPITGEPIYYCEPNIFIKNLEITENYIFLYGYQTIRYWVDEDHFNFIED